VRRLLAGLVASLLPSHLPKRERDMLVSSDIAFSTTSLQNILG
jgi:hypothetical protein